MSGTKTEELPRIQDALKGAWQIDRQTDRNTDRQIDRHSGTTPHSECSERCVTDRQTDGHTDRQIDG